MKQTDVELIDIFNLNPHLIKKSLEKTLDLVKKMKKEIKENDIEFFINKLFSTNSNSTQNQKFIIKHNSMKISNLSGFSFDLSLLHDKTQREYYKTEISKTLIIQSVIRTLKKLSDKYYKDINIEELINNALKLYRNLVSTGKSKKYNRRSSCLSLGLVDERQTNFLSLKCHIKVIYNSPIYIFKFRDLKIRKIEIEKVLINHIPKRAFSISKREKRRLLNTNWLFSNTKQSSNKDLIKVDFTIGQDIYIREIPLVLGRFSKKELDDKIIQDSKSFVGNTISININKPRANQFKVLSDLDIKNKLIITNCKRVFQYHLIVNYVLKITYLHLYSQMKK